MSRPESWKSVAIALGDRLRNHAWCGEHAESEADDACPFCQDRSAFRRFERRLRHDGQHYVDRTKDATFVSVFDVAERAPLCSAEEAQ